jgi:serine/threonine protein phosphatase PrpC
VLRISGVAVSHVGLVRSGNEDAGFIGGGLMLVADGVGGAAAGEVAAATAAYVVSALALAEPDAEPIAALRRAVRLAQEQVAHGVQLDPARAGMATTLTALQTDGSRFALAHLGDSRGYLFRDGVLTRLTRDHTYVQRLVDEGTLREHDVPHHPWRNVVLRSVNGSREEGGEVAEVDLVAGDRVLLASDGLTDLVREERIAALLGSQHDDAAAQSLVDEALALGGRDNVTCVLATVVESTGVAQQDLLVGAARDPRNVVDPGAVRLPHPA